MKALDPGHRAILAELELDQLVGLPPVPRGYVFARAKTYGLFGFSDVNDRQAVFTFHTLEHRAHRAPLRVFVAHEPAGQFWGTQRRQPQKDELLTRSSARYATEYFDGYWEAPWRYHLPDVDADGWTKVDRHTLVVRTGPVALAVTGFRSQGIEKEDLIEIAGAML